MRALTVFVFLCAVSAFGEVAVHIENVSPEEFFTKYSGRYIVDLVNGAKPHEGTDVGQVSTEDKEGLFSFAFCSGDGFCDLNDQYFPFDKVTIKKNVFSLFVTSYELTYEENGTKKRFTWDETNNKITLRNYQYSVGGKLTTLEHQLHRKTDGELGRIDAAQFFQSMSGDYLIVKAQGSAPHETTKGRIEIIDGEGSIAFPYCHPAHGCFLNEQIFAFGQTNVTVTHLDKAKTLYELSVQEDGELKKFTWEENAGQFTLKNYQFKIQGEKILLEQEAKKIPN